jgi:hypothetical protein
LGYVGLGLVKRVKTDIVWTAILERYWLAVMFLLLIVIAFVSRDIAVFTALVFTFLVPGLIAYRFLNLDSHEIWAFVPIFSILVSVQLIYYLSLVMGYSQHSILVGFLALTAIYIVIVYKKGEPIKPQKLLKLKQIKKTSLLVFAVIFLLSLAVL